MIDLLLEKIYEIVDFIKKTFFTKENQKYENFIKSLGSKVKDISIDFYSSPRRVYELYSDIYTIINKNYNKLSKDADSVFIATIKNKMDVDIPKENLGVIELLNLFRKYDDLAKRYKDLGKRINTFAKTKAKNGERCDQEKQLLSIIAKIVTGIRINMKDISPKRLFETSEFKKTISRTGDMILSDPKEMALYGAIGGAIGAGASIGYNMYKSKKEQK